MNVLYVDGSRVALLSGEKFVQGDLAQLRALGAQVGAKGSTVLLMPAEIERAELPDNLAPEQIMDYLRANKGGLVVSRPGVEKPIVYAHLDLGTLAPVQSAARTAGLRLTQMIPASVAALRATGVSDTAVIIHPLEDTFEITTVSRNRVQTRQQAKNDRMDLQRATQIATTTLQSAGDTPDVVVIGDELPNTELRTHQLSLPDVMRGALQGAPVLSESLSMTQWVSGIEGPLTKGGKVPAGLLIGLGLSAAMMLGVLVGTRFVEKEVEQLTGQRTALQAEADAVQALRTSNDYLETRNKQAKQLTENKGSLRNDLPLIATRISEQGARLRTLAGPNTPTENDTRAFGKAIERTYDMNADVRSVEEFASAFQQDGLAADIRNVDCSKEPCTVSFRAAPTELTEKKPASGTEVAQTGGTP